MYQIGELVQYGTSGVCRIEDIVQDVPGLPKDAECYLLIPVSKKEEKIYTPVDNDKVKMRRILSREEAMELLEKVSEIKGPVILNEKQCEPVYREELYSIDCYRWLGLLKTLYARREARIAMGKKITTTDERYLKSVEERMKEELNLVIGEEKTSIALDKIVNPAK